MRDKQGKRRRKTSGIIKSTKNSLWPRFLKEYDQFKTKSSGEKAIFLFIVIIQPLIDYHHERTG